MMIGVEVVGLWCHQFPPINSLSPPSGPHGAQKRAEALYEPSTSAITFRAMQRACLWPLAVEHVFLDFDWTDRLGQSFQGCQELGRLGDQAGVGRIFSGVRTLFFFRVLCCPVGFCVQQGQFLRSAVTHENATWFF